MPLSLHPLKKQQNIRNLSLEHLTAWLKGNGQPAFRARQVYEWLWEKSATTFDEMTSLSKPLRKQLEKAFFIDALLIKTRQQSTDGTVKFAFQTFDGHVIEGVLIPTEDRQTACVSSQVGCSLSCSFCATGFLKRERNLSRGEIYDQYVLINKEAKTSFDRNLTNVVFMGMGEPLLNYKNVVEGIERLTNENGLGISPKRITVSTAGIAKMIKKLGDDGVKFNLALSLHATDDESRNKVMAINETNNLKVLVEALNYFYRKTRNQITYEYILLDGINDSYEDAKRLISLARKVPEAKVNIIEYNPIDQVDYKKPEDSKREQFIKILDKSGVTATVRRSRGKDIDAACGQLANKG